MSVKRLNIGISAAVVLAVVSGAWATTVSVTDTVQPIGTIDNAKNDQTYPDSVSWTHSNPYPGTSADYHAAVTAGLIDLVQLAITTRWDVSNPAVPLNVTFTDYLGNDHPLGSLDQTTVTTTFGLTASWLDGVDVKGAVKATGNPGQGGQPALIRATIESSELTVVYEQPASPVPGVVPEPVTMIGMLLGVSGIAGYTRRRRLA
jgi:hypothetical protein